MGMANESQGPDAQVDDDPFNLGEETPDKPRDDKGRFAPTTPQEPAEETPPAPRQNAYRQRLMSEAVELGFAEDELADMSDATIATTIHRILRDRLRTREEFSRAQTLEDAQAPRRQAAAPAPEPEEQYDLGVDESQLDPVGVQALKHITKSTNSRIKKLEAELAEERKKNAERDTRNTFHVIDQAFDLLGPAYEKLLGQGTGQELVGKQQAALKRRMALLNEVGSSGVNIQQLTARQLAIKLKEAADTIFGEASEPKPTPQDPYAGAGNPKPKGNGRVTSDQWNDATLAPATQRRPPVEKPGTAKALKGVAAALAETNGAKAGQEELDEFFEQGT